MNDALGMKDSTRILLRSTLDTGVESCGRRFDKRYGPVALPTPDLGLLLAAAPRKLSSTSHYAKAEPADKCGRWTAKVTPKLQAKLSPEKPRGR